MCNQSGNESGCEQCEEIRAEKRAREERIDRLFGELRESMSKSRAIIDGWRERGILPPQEPSRRF